MLSYEKSDMLQQLSQFVSGNKKNARSYFTSSGIYFGLVLLNPLHQREVHSMSKQLVFWIYTERIVVNTGLL